jgi:uncharacterized protein
LIIKLSDIEDKLVLKGEMNTLAFKNLEERQFAIESPVIFEVLIKKQDDNIRITGPVRSTAKMVCSLCLGEFSCSIDAYLDVELVPKGLIPQASDIELRPDDLDIYYYEGDEIDLDPFIYDEVLLNLPVRPVCKEGCAGLCQSCGTNRNIESCSCHQDVNTAFGEKLKFFLNTKGEQHGSSKT